MRRREFITLLAGIAVAGPLAGQSKEADRPRHIIALFPLGTDDPDQMVRRVTLRLALENIGWTDGRGARIEYRHASSPADYVRLARETVAKKPDLIFAQSTGVAVAVAHETRTIPVVFANVPDPVGAGLVATLARPGGNLTGLSLFEPIVVGKWLSMLKDGSSRMRRAVLIGDPKTAVFDYFVRSAAAAAARFGLQSVAARAETAEDVERMIESVAVEPDTGLVIAPSPLMLGNRGRIIALAARHRLPAVYPERVYAADGGLMSYGLADLNEPFKQAATYIDRILNGTQPGDLPVQAPGKYALVVNRGTAKTLGFVIPKGAEVVE
jgi:putative tryptophan/tyrosine transport system substrate-binding protein